MKPSQFVLQDKYLSVIVDGKPFSLNASHPTFSAMKRAIERKQWNRLPKLVTLAERLMATKGGAVTIKNGNVYYHGRVIHSTLTTRIIQMVKEGKKVAPMLKFMDNLYQNPSQDCINELYEFLRHNKLPITDDGCFMAYKIVDKNYKDCHSHSVDNQVGAVPIMPRKNVDGDRRTLCSNGYHFCSLAYLSSSFPGAFIMGIKINPKDVVSIPEMVEGKGRTWRYEVVMELADRDPVSVTKDAPIYLTSVLPVEADRKKLLAKVLAHPIIKRAIAKRKLKVANLRKGTLGRLTKLYAKLPLLNAPLPSKLEQNPIQVARVQAGLSIGDVAKELGVPSKLVYDAERFSKVGQAKADKFIEAIQKALERRNRIGAAAIKALILGTEPTVREFEQPSVVGSHDESEDEGSY
jgi:hypothetical protein